METVEAMFAEIGLLVLEGDAAGLAAKVSELSAARREPQVPAASASEEQAAAPESPRSPVVPEDHLPPEAAGVDEVSVAGQRGAPAPLIHSRDS